MNRLKNNQAFTLVEVLASITILAIVVAIFLTIFTNTTLFSSKTEDKLTAINLADKELYEITSAIKSCDNINSYNKSEISLNNKTYASTVECVPSTNDEEGLGLLPISVSISRDGKILTTAYGYVDTNPSEGDDTND